MNTITRITVSIRRALNALRDLGRRTWQAHIQLLRDNPSYAAAAAVGVAAIVGQDNLLDLIAAICAALLGIYAALRRSISRWEAV